MAMSQEHTDPYKALHREANKHDFDVQDAMVSSLYSNLSWNRLQQIVADLGIDLPIRNRTTACDKLAEYGVFYGPVGDDTVYVHKDGVTKTLGEHLDEQEVGGMEVPWE